MSRPGTSNQLALRDFEDDDDDENDSGLPPSRGGNSGGGNFGGNAPGTPSSSRARMLAQQRELQLKKRQNNINGSGMIRSSVETATAGNNSVNSSVSSLKQSTDGQFTPAIRQFSAPKSVRSESFHEYSI